MVDTCGLWFIGMVIMVGIEFKGTAPNDEATFRDSANGGVVVAAVVIGLSGVFTDGVLVSVFMVTVVMVSEATIGPVERGGGETDTVFFM